MFDLLPSELEDLVVPAWRGEYPVDRLDFLASLASISRTWRQRVSQDIRSNLCNLKERLKLLKDAAHNGNQRVAVLAWRLGLSEEERNTKDARAALNFAACSAAKLIYPDLLHWLGTIGADLREPGRAFLVTMYKNMPYPERTKKCLRIIQVLLHHGAVDQDEAKHARTRCEAALQKPEVHT